MKVITILPVSGNNPYAWLRNGAEDPSTTGICVADAASGFRFGEFRVSSGLEASFREWFVRFDGARGNPAFAWRQFHEDGIELAKRLKTELGIQARVIYAKPPEDPRHGNEQRIEVLSNGTLIVAARRFTPQRA